MNRRKTLLMLGTFVAAVSAFAFAPSSYVNVGRIASYWNTVQAYDSVLGGQPGGKVATFLCDSTTGQTLLVGDVVYILRNNMVAKGTTITLYNALAGVVVGGSFKGMQVAQSATNFAATDTACVAAGTTSGTWPNNKVIVMTEGRTWVKIDAAAGLAPGSLLWPSTTVAGKVKGAVAVPDSFFRTVGRLIDTGIVSTAVMAHVVVK